MTATISSLAQPADLSSLLAAWREASPVAGHVGDNRADMALIRSLLSGEEVPAALVRFAEAEADAGLVLSECCDHLAALVDVLRDRFPGTDTDVAWTAVPAITEVFYGDPLRWGEDPLTGCTSSAYLRVALREAHRRAAAGGEVSALVVAALRPVGDLGRVVAGYITSASALVNAVPEAATVSHVLPGCFAVLVPEPSTETVRARMAQALGGLGLPVSVSVQPVPDPGEVDDSFPRTLLASCTGPAGWAGAQLPLAHFFYGT